MSGERGIEIKVGILVTVCLGLLVAFIILLGDFTTSDTKTLYADFVTSADLKTGSPVKIAGVGAGKVKAVDYRGGEVDPKDGHRVYVRITLAIEEEKVGTIREDAQLWITTQGVLGEKYVEVDPGTPESPVVAPGDVLVGQPPLRLEILGANASRILESLSGVLERNEKHIDTVFSEAADTVVTVKRAMERIDTLLADNHAKVSKIFDEVLTIEAGAKDAVASVNVLLDAAKNAMGDGGGIKRTIHNVERLTASAGGQIGTVVRDIKRTLDRYQALAGTGQGAIKELRAQVGVTMGKVDAILTDVKGISATVRSGKGTVGALLADREMYDDLRELMADIKRHPWKFLWKE